MGEVFLKYRIMPEGADTDLDALQESLKAALPDFASIQNAEAVPFAFGMKALVVGFVVEDEEGNNDTVEEAINGTDGVQGVEMLEMGRL